MAMGRYLCQLCYSIVHYGERHPCFFYKDEDEVYTVPPPNEPEEMGRRLEETQETHSGNWNENNLIICTAAQTNRHEECEDRNSSVIENYETITLVPALGTKRRCFSMFPPFRGITSTNMDSECASNTRIERDNNKDGEKRSKGQRKRKRASAEATQTVDSSSIGMATCSPVLGSVAHWEAENIAGPSEIRTQSLGSENERAFVCDVCGRDFARIDHLDRHRRSHTGEKPFACLTCSKAFANKSGMERHLLTHTGEKSFPCDKCDKRFALKQYLDLHARTHTGEKPYKCDICGKRFTLKHHLDRHLRTHTGEKPFKCKRCGKDYADRSRYKRHQKNIHGEE